MKKDHKASDAALSKKKNAVSLFVFLIDRLGDWFYHAIANGCFGKIFTAYSSEQAAFEASFLKNHFSTGTKFKLYFRKIRSSLSRSFETSVILNGMGKLLRGFLRIPLRTCGNTLFAFGLYTVLIYFVKILVPGLTASDDGVVITGVAICIVALPMLLSRDSIAAAIGKSIITRMIFVDTFGFRDEVFEVPLKNKRLTHNLFIAFGMLLGMLTVFTHPLAICLLLGVAVGLILIFQSPEIGILSAIIFLPFFSWFQYPAIYFCLLILITTISYGIKLMRGKRILKMELMDLSILLFMLVLFFSGRISAGGHTGYLETLLSSVLVCGYFLVVNLIRTEKWLQRCVVALVSSGTLVAIIGILQYILGLTPLESWLDTNYFPEIHGRAVSVFENPNVLAIYLVIVFPFALYLFTQSTKKNSRFLCDFSIASLLVCTILTWSRGAWIAMIVEILFFALLYRKKTVRWLSFIVLSIPFLPMILPESVTKRFLSIGNLADSSTMYRLYTWKGSFRVIDEYFWSGIGYGPSAFQSVYPQFAYAGIEAAEHSHNLFLQILLGLGIGGLLVFLAVVFLFMQMSFEHICQVKESETKLLVGAAVFSVIAALIMGLFDFIWYNYRVFFLFWVVVGLSCACIRVKQAEIQRHSFIDSTEEVQATVDV